MSAFINSKGEHVVLLAVSGVNDVMSTFRSDDAGHVQLRLRNDGVAKELGHVLVAVGHDFESANAAVMYHARSLVLDSKKSTGEFDEEMKALREGVNPEWMENWYDGLGFCKWALIPFHMPLTDQIQVLGTLWAKDSRMRKFSRRSTSWPSTISRSPA